jgi:hypothetical protein
MIYAIMLLEYLQYSFMYKMKAICMTVEKTFERLKHQIPYGQDGTART